MFFFSIIFFHYLMRFLTSVAFGAEYPFTNITDDYDYVLRADADTYITEKILNWVPPRGSAFR